MKSKINDLAPIFSPEREENRGLFSENVKKGLFRLTFGLKHVTINLRWWNNMNEIRQVFSSEILWNEIDQLNNDKIPLYKYIIKDYHFESPNAIMGWKHIFKEAEFYKIYSTDFGENIVLEIVANRDITKKFLGEDKLQLARHLFEEEFRFSVVNKNLRIIWN